LKVNAKPVTIDTDQIQNLIPHTGNMCLLNHVRSFDTQGIVCIASSHRLITNPLRENNILHVVCGIEYAAQAMALHGALISTAPSQTPRAGRLAGVRSVQFVTSRLDNIEEDLEIVATQLMGDENSMVYEFTVKTPHRVLLNGKATVVLVS
jgi:predicted hotdog family 3-hydroxylacyl-ACP dehydratase